jgi:hypothetical protein
LLSVSVFKGGGSSRHPDNVRNVHGKKNELLIRQKICGNRQTTSSKN